MGETAGRTAALTKARASRILTVVPPLGFQFEHMREVLPSDQVAILVHALGAARPDEMRRLVAHARALVECPAEG
jgi:hypothetical protein